MGNDQYDFSIGGTADYSDTVYYYVAAQDRSLNKNVKIQPEAGASGISVDPPSVTISPDSPDFYPMRSAFSGVYLIGTTGGFDFTALTKPGGFF